MWLCEGWNRASAGPVGATSSRMFEAERHGASPLYSTTGSTGGRNPSASRRSRSSSRYNMAVYSSTRSAIVLSFFD